MSIYYLSGDGLLKLATLLNLVHEVPTIHILHHKVQPVLVQGRVKTLSCASFAFPGKKLNNKENATRGQHEHYREMSILFVTTQLNSIQIEV